MPAFVSHVPIYLHELLEYGATTSGALRRETSRIVEVAKHVPVMLVIGILRSEQGRTQRACEVFHMELLVWEEDESSASRNTEGMYELHAVM
jgi:hypothetical protein